MVVACGSKATTPSPATCSVDGDCVIQCESKGDCCHNPYCESAQLASIARDATDYNQDHCTKADYDKCPRVGSRDGPDDKVVARCKAGACVAEHIPITKDHVDSSRYDKTCATADDCVIVDEWKCNKCGCSDKVIAKKERDRFDAALQATTCTPDNRQCGDCRGFKAACEAGKCVTHPEP